MSHSQTVRLNRKRTALSQGDLADLLAISQTAISRLEGAAESTTLETALGLQVVFDLQPRLLFHRLYASVEEAVMARATKLDRQLRGKTDAASLKKQRLLGAMVKRAKPVTKGA